MMADVDRRVRRTKRDLHNALIELMTERGYDKLSIKDILDRADVSRSTFYAHFRDKDALLLSSFEGLRDDLRRILTTFSPDNPPATPAQPSELIFEHAAQNRYVYRALCGRHGCGIVADHLRTTIASVLLEHLRPHLKAAGSALSPQIVTEFYASALVGLLQWWVTNDFQPALHEMADAFGVLSTPGIQAALAHGNP
jgi:AcrR family transcriptional regulator